MKFRLIIFLIFILSCSPQLTTLNKKKPYSAKGFAYIYNDFDFNEKIIKGKMNNEIMQISHQNLKVGTLIKIINPKNKENIVLKNSKRIKYPEFYKILITKPVAEKLNLKKEAPLVEIIEVKKNKSFVAKKSKVFKEEEKAHSSAPVENVKIDTISKNKKKKDRINKDNFYIIIAQFYSKDSASLLKKRITQELTNFNSKKLYIKLKKSNKITLLSGPYSSINLMKNDYIQLKNFGFEELDISINE